MGYVDAVQLERLATGMKNEYGSYLRDVIAQGRERR